VATTRRRGAARARADALPARLSPASYPISAYLGQLEIGLQQPVFDANGSV
jgi:hypothetical protein